MSGGRPSPAGTPGLQRERTGLAWDRTGLSFIVVGALLLRAGGSPYHHPRHVPGAMAIALGALVVVAAARHSRSPGTGEPEGVRPRPVAVRVVGVAATLVCLSALAITLLGG